MDREILEGVLREFENLAAIPRPSKHEEKISAFLQKYLSDLNFHAERDEYNNIIAEVPASVGRENSPLTVLQAHMDMVCVAEAGRTYNPLTDPIKLIRTEKFLQADGTSLGADDGMGIAEILYIVKNFRQGGKFENVPHGAIRIIFTTDEEQGMSGAIGIDEKYFRDANFLINCDSENYDEIIVGSAGSIHAEFFRKIRRTDNGKLGNAYLVKLGGLRGGHSGDEIHKGRANSIKLAAKFLQKLELAGSFWLANFSGGSASNVIPNSAEILFAADLDEKIISDFCAKLKIYVEKVFGDVEENFKIEFAKIDMPKDFLSDEDAAELVNLISIIHSGIYSMSRTAPDMVESSANIGIVRTTEGEIKISFLPRSNVTEVLEDFREMMARAAELTGFALDIGEPTSAWNYNPKSRLLKIMSENFERQNNFPAKIRTIHAGLECSSFLAKNPALDVVSIGTTNENIHSTKERLHLDTVVPQVNLIIATLEKISALN